MSARDQFDFGNPVQVPNGLLLSSVELQEMTGYAKPALQLKVLLAQGFYRARRNALNRVVLERAHYEAVCAGAATSISISRERPQVASPFRSTSK